MLFSRPVDDREWTATVLGPTTRAVVIQPTDRRAQLHIYLQPGIATAMFGSSPGDLRNDAAPLREVWRASAADRLLDDLGSAESFAAWRRIVGRGLAPRDEPTAGAKLARRALREIRATNGRIRIASLAGGFGVSVRQLERTFECHVGVPAKLSARIARFDFARAALRSSSGRAADVALRAGYSDQAHMTREFRALGGLSPSRLRERG